MKKNSIQQKQPKSLWLLSSAMALFTWVLFSNWALITLYLQRFPGIDTKTAYELYAAYASLMFTLPLPAGYLATSFGYKNSALLGLGFCVLGVVGLMTNQISFVYLAMASYLVGNAFYTPSMLCLVDAIYSKDDVRRDSGFTLNYIIFNIGGIFGIFIGGFINQNYGYQFEFGLDLVILGFAFVAYLIAIKYYQLAPKRLIAPQLFWSPMMLRTVLLITIFIAIGLVLLLLRHVEWNAAVEIVFGVLALAACLFVGVRQQDKSQAFRVYAFIILCIFGIVFWMIYNLEPSLISVFAKTSIDRTIGTLSIPPDAFAGFDSLFVVLLGLVLNRVWLYLAKRNRDLSLPTKFCYSLLFAALGWLMLYGVMQVMGLAKVYALWWIILAYFIWDIGELLIAPIGFSMVGRLAPRSHEGLFMGVWQYIVGIGAVLSGFLSQLTVLPKANSLVIVNHAYAQLFFQVGITALVCFGVLMLVSIWVRRLL